MQTAPLRRQARDAEALIAKLAAERARIETRLADPAMYAPGKAGGHGGQPAAGGDRAGDGGGGGGLAGGGGGVGGGGLDLISAAGTPSRPTVQARSQL